MEILTTCYMGSKNSSKETRDRAEELSKEIGTRHFNVEIDKVTQSFNELFKDTTGMTP